MNMTNLADIRQLSIAERLQLIEDIWDTIATDAEQLPLTEAQRAEIERRLDAYDQRPESGRPWREVLEELRTISK